MKPRVPITSSEFRYIDAANTNLRRSFAKYRREQREAAAREQAVREEAQAKVRAIAKGKP